MNRRYCLAVLVLLASVATLVSSVAFASEEGPQGVWLTQDSTMAIQITACGDHLCGKIVWLADSVPSTDQNNRVAALRQRDLKGLEVLTGLPVSPDAKGRYKGGEFYDPAIGRTFYRCSLQVTDEGDLQLRGYPDLLKNGRLVRSRFGRTVRWQRTDLTELSAQ